MNAHKLPRNDTSRCQNCDGFGQIQRIKTKSKEGNHLPNENGEYSDSADWGRIQFRVLECRDCGHTWRSDR